MSNNSQDGGPAFPHKNPNYDGNWDKEPQRGGMSLRDYFAGQALAGLLGGRGGPIQRKFLSDEASLCYEYADAMLAERNKTNG